MQSLPSLEGVTKAEKRLKGLIRVTPLEFNKRLSNITNSTVLLKREDVEVMTQVLNWGITPWCIDENAEDGLMGEIMKRSLDEFR